MSEETPKPTGELLVPVKGEPVTPEETRSPAPAARTIPLAAALAFLVAGLLVVLLVVNLGRRSAHDVDPLAISAIRSEIEARRADLNRQRAELNLAPLPSHAVPVDEVAGRLKKEADTLVQLTVRFQEALADKDRLLSRQNAEIVKSGQDREILAAEVARLKNELRQSGANGANSTEKTGTLNRDLATLRAERDALSTEAAALREQMASQKPGKSEADFEDLRRSLEESRNAREFFEKRVKELEAQGTAPAPDSNPPPEAAPLISPED